MPKLTFDYLEIRGFKCFAEQTNLALWELGPGLHFVRGRNEAEPRLGPNGAGKSSLWDALCWCLYGRTPDGSRNPDIKPWLGKKQTCVRLHVKVNKRTYAIRRTANPNSLTLDDAAVGQEQIDQFIGLSYEAFTHTILLGQGQPLFLDLQPRDKMALFSDVLDLERWECRSALASERVRQFEQAEAQLFGELAGLENSKTNLGKLRVAAVAMSTEWETTHSSKQRASIKQLEDAQKNLERAQARFAERDAKYDWACCEIKSMREDLDRLRNDMAGFQMLTMMRDKLNNKLIKPDQNCPTCGQPWPAKRSWRNKIKQELKQIDEALRRANKAKKQAENIVETLSKRQHVADEIQAELDLLRQTISELTAQKNALQRALTEREEEANPYKQQLSDLRKQLNKIGAEMKVMKADMEKVVRRAERAKFWVKGFKDVRLFLIDEVLQELTLATNAALEDVGLIGWNVSYDVEKETKSGGTQRGLNVMITSPETKQRVRWESWSGGEGQRLRVVAALALSETLLQHAGVTCDLEILDEPAHFMAPDGVRDLVEFLAARAQALGKQTWLVDHMAIDSACFASVTTVVKSKDGARIENA